MSVWTVSKPIWTIGRDDHADRGMLEHFQEQTNAQIDRTSAQIDKILAAVAADGENIHALALIAES